MKTSKFLKIISPIVITLLICIQVVTGQISKIDSIIYEKKLSYIDGTIPTYYSSFCKSRALETRALLQKAIKLYSKNDSNVFKIKLAVVDSANWTGFEYQYGIFFFNQDWIVIPGDLTFRKCKSLYGFDSFSDVMIKKFLLLSNNPEDLITNTFYTRLPLHELGHYYIRKILKATPPNSFTSELMATYFATDYLYREDKGSYKAMNLYFATLAQGFNPRYRSIADFNTKYTSVGLQNYVWYHAAFQPLIIDVYSNYKTEFMSKFANTFPATNKPKNLNEKDILEILDNITGGKTSKWVKVIEGTNN